MLNVSHSMIDYDEQKDIEKLMILASKKQFLENVMKDF